MDQDTISTRSMGERAAKLLTLGLSLFPLFTIESGHCSCGNARCSSPGKHPIGSLVPQGVLNAERDPQAIREWWAVYPDANIGIATGDASGVVVVDIDPRHGGEATIANLESRFGELPDTWVSLTGGGGMHFFFAMPAMDIRNSAGAIGPGVDIRGNGGYVVAPPSLHVSGERYAWSPLMRPSKTPMGEMPGWLIDRITGRASGTFQPKTLPAKIKEGERNVWMASAAGSMRRKGFCAEAIYAAIAVENRLRCTPPMDDREVRRIAQSIERYDPEIGSLGRVRFS